MLQGFISLFSTPARAYAFLFICALVILFITIVLVNVYLMSKSQESDNISDLDKGKLGLLKKIFLKKKLNKEVKKVIIDGKEVDFEEKDLKAIKKIMDERKKKLELDEKQKKMASEEQAKKLKSKEDEKKKLEAQKKKELEEKRKKEKEIEENQEELQGIRDEAKRVMEEMHSKLSEYEQAYQSLDQIQDILSYKDDYKYIEDVKQRSDLDRLLEKQGALNNAFDWHKELDMKDANIIEVREVAFSEEQVKGFLDNLMSDLIPLVDRGLSDAQITRTLANKNEYQIPSHELVPMMEAVRNCLSILDSKNTSAKNRFTDANFDIDKARDALLRGETKDAIKIMESRMKLLEKTAVSLNGAEKDEMLAKASDISRDLAVMVKVSNIKEWFKYINHSLALSESIKSLNVLGYMNIRMNDLNGAENVFMKALKNYNEKSFWSNLAKDGMETVKKLKGEESYENSVAKEAEKIKNIMKDNSKQKLASAYRLKIRIQGHQNTR